VDVVYTYRFDVNDRRQGSYAHRPVTT